MLTIGKSFTLSCAHFLPGHPTCGNVHGHTYKVTIEITGTIGKNGMVIDFNDVSAIIARVRDRFDHKLLNDILPVPTCENLAIYFFNFFKEEIKPLIEFPQNFPNYELTITIQEGEGGYATYSEN